MFESGMTSPGRHDVYRFGVGEEYCSGHVAWRDGGRIGGKIEPHRFQTDETRYVLSITINYCGACSLQ